MRLLNYFLKRLGTKRFKDVLFGQKFLFENRVYVKLSNTHGCTAHWPIVMRRFRNSEEVLIKV